jgi:hypothetical protein
VDIVYRFVATGNGDVEKAFTGIEKAARAQKKAVDDAGKATRATAPQGTRQRASVEERAQAKAANDAQRAAKREADAKIREADRAQKHVSRIRDRHFADEQRKDERIARDRQRRAEKDASAVARKETAARERAKKETSSRQAKSFGTLRDIGSGALLGGVASGVALIGAAASESMRLQEASARIAINSRKAGEKARDPNELRRSFEATAIATPGIKSIDIADAVGRFVSLTGDVDTALKSQGTFATVASATGGNVGDIAEAAASLSAQFDIKGIEDMREALAALTFQGKEGSFELKDAAAQFQRLAASGAAFGIPKGVQGVKTLGGLTQIARSGTGSAEQAATAVENLLTNLKVKQKDLKAAGVDVFRDGKARDVQDLIVESISKVGGNDIAKKNAGLSRIFGEQGIRAINPLVAKYTTAFQGAKGTDEQKAAAGIAALRAEIERSINAPGDYAQVQEDAAMAQKGSSARLTAAWEAIMSKTGDALLPSIAKLAEVFAGKSSMLDPFIEAVGLAADAVVAFSDFMGFSTPKTKQQITKEQRTIAEKAAKEFDAKAGIGPLTPEQQVARDALFASSDAAYRDQWGISADGSKPKGDMGLKGFVDQYMAAGGIDPTERGSVEMLGGALQKNPMDEVRSNDFFMGNFGGENEAQRDVRRQFQSEVAGKKAEAEFDTKAAQDAANAFAATVANVNAAIAAAGQPSNI